MRHRRCVITAVNAVIAFVADDRVAAGKSRNSVCVFAAVKGVRAGGSVNVGHEYTPLLNDSRAS